MIIWIKWIFINLSAVQDYVFAGILLAVKFNNLGDCSHKDHWLYTFTYINRIVIPDGKYHALPLPYSHGSKIQLTVKFFRPVMNYLE